MTSLTLLKDIHIILNLQLTTNDLLKLTTKMNNKLRWTENKEILESNSEEIRWTKNKTNFIPKDFITCNIEIYL